MISFGLITEGITDQIVLENILYGFFSNGDIPINPLCPLRDATDKNRMDKAGNWVEVLEYCASSKFRTEIFNNDFLIIQIDTDVFRSENVSQKYKIVLNDMLSVSEITEIVRLKFIEIINQHHGKFFFEQYQERIIFAITVDSIECWLLPLYYANEPKKADKYVNCLNTLNAALSRKEGFTIAAKEPQYYRNISKKFKKRSELLQLYPLNSSFSLFIKQLEEKNIVLAE